MPKVFVASLPTRWDAATKKQVPSLDLNPAMEFGELVILSEGRKTILEMDETLEAVCDRAGEFKDGDYLLMIGDPIINAAFYSAIENLDGVADINCLRWVRKDRIYEVITT